MSPTPDDVPSTWDERATIAAFLDYARGGAVAKCDGLSDDLARVAPLTTSPLMTIAGVVNHLRWVEYSWFDVRLFGHDDEGPWTEEEPDREFSMATDLPLAQVIAEYEQQCEHYRHVVAGLDLDLRSVRAIRTGDHVTLRWILLHLVEETARHNGHLDIVRELLDGSTG